MREQDRERQKHEWEKKERMADEFRAQEEQETRRHQENMQQRMMKQDEEMRRRQQENSLFMQAQQLNNMLDQQEMSHGGNNNGGGNGGNNNNNNGNRKNFNDNDNRRNFDMMNQGVLKAKMSENFFKYLLIYYRRQQRWQPRIPKSRRKSGRNFSTPIQSKSLKEDE